MCHIVKLVCLTVLLLVTVQSLRDDHYFYEMSPLTELGRYLNQSETDFETKMKPVCSCQSLPFRTNYTDEYCYCTLVRKLLKFGVESYAIFGAIYDH